MPTTTDKAVIAADMAPAPCSARPAVSHASVGAQAAIAGRVDPVADVLKGTPESIRRAVAQSYAAIGNPHLVMAGCEIPSATPKENLKALCEPVAYS